MIATARKIQIVADAIVGRETYTPTRKLDTPWATYLTWIAEYRDDAGAHCEVAQLLNDFYTRYILRGEEDVQEHYKRIRAAITDPINYPNAAEVIDTLPDVRWLWKNWIPRGLVSLLAATPGTGKSYLALDLAHRLITGGVWPDGSPVQDPSPVLYVDAEYVPSIVKLRLSVWRRPDLTNLTLMWPDAERSFINLDDVLDRERLWDMCEQVRPGLVIVDSYGSVTLRGENNKEDVQLLLAFLSLISQEFDCGMMIVHHLRKSPGGQRGFLPMTTDSIRGSGHIPAMARNVLGLQWIPTSEHPDENGPRRLWVLKSNVAQHPDPLGVLLDPHPENDEVALLRYGDAPQAYREHTKSDECAEWLEDVLREAGEPLKPKEIFEMGKPIGFRKRMISEVRGKMKERIIDTEDKYHQDNQWQWSG